MQQKLKTVNPWFTDVWEGLKLAEVRPDDRNFSLEDDLWLKEYDDETGEYSGREIHALPLHILKAEDYPQGLKPGFVMISIDVVGRYIDGVHVSLIPSQSD